MALFLFDWKGMKKMNIVNFGVDERTMTSREIAELTGKRHKHVLVSLLLVQAVTVLRPV
mgnify:CR=1 FL=1